MSRPVRRCTAYIAVLGCLLAGVASGELHRSRNKMHVVEIKGLRFTIADQGELLAFGEFKDAPRRVLVLDAEPAAVVVGKDLRLLDAKGRWRWTAPLVPSVLWLEETRQRVVVVAGKKLFGLDIVTGERRELGAEVVRAALRRRRDRERALQAAVETDPRAFEADVAPLLDERKLPKTQRLLVRVLQARAGGDAVADRTWDVRSRRGIELNVRYRDAGDVVGWLEEVAVDDEKLARPALRALAGMGERGARALAGLLGHGDVSAAAKRAATRDAAALPKKFFVPALVRELGRAEGDPDNAGALLTALLATGADDVGKRVQKHERVLMQVLEAGTAPVDWLADHFRARPTSEAVPGLLKQLGRSRRGSLDKKLMAALKACTGADFGRDKTAWQKGLRNFGR